MPLVSVVLQCQSNAEVILFSQVVCVFPLQEPESLHLCFKYFMLKLEERIKLLLLSLSFYLYPYYYYYYCHQPLLFTTYPIQCHGGFLKSWLIQCFKASKYPKEMYLCI